MLPRRQFLHLAAGAAAVPAMSRVAWAQTYPTRPLRIVVGFAPAGASDIAARLIGQWLSERLGQQFTVENRAGAGGNIATETVVRAPADGYTLLLAGSNDAINATLYEKRKFNFIRDIAPVSGIVRVPKCHGDEPIGSSQDGSGVHRLRKANPGNISMASAGTEHRTTWQANCSR
jgi:tripartite-type tricarboxylate transporter receptor subunit TctC